MGVEQYKTMGEWDGDTRTEKLHRLRSQIPEQNEKFCRRLQHLRLKDSVRPQVFRQINQCPHPLFTDRQIQTLILGNHFIFLPKRFRVMFFEGELEGEKLNIPLLAAALTDFFQQGQILLQIGGKQLMALHICQ